MKGKRTRNSYYHCSRCACESEIIDICQRAIAFEKVMVRVMGKEFAEEAINDILLGSLEGIRICRNVKREMPNA